MPASTLTSWYFSFSTAIPGPKRSGVKMTLPSVSRTWLFSMPLVPGWLCLSSVLWV